MAYNLLDIVIIKCNIFAIATNVNIKMQPASNLIDDTALAKIAVAKAGGLRALEEVTGIARSTITRLQNGYTVRLRKKTKRIIVDYING